MRRLLSRILIFAGVAMILVAGGFYAYNIIYDHNAGQRSRDLLDEMMAGFEWDLPPLSQMAYNPSSEATNSSNREIAQSSDETLTPSFNRRYLQTSGDDAPLSSEEQELSFGEWTAPQLSYSVIGVLSIPRLGVRLPVIGECSDALLSISCTRLSGGYDPKPNRLVIAGHNISSHFKGIDTLEAGDQVAFTTIDGETYYYSMTEMSDIRGTDGADVLAATGWDLTLLTCKTERTMRTMVRFVEIT